MALDLLTTFRAARGSLFLESFLINTLINTKLFHTALLAMSVFQRSAKLRRFLEPDTKLPLRPDDHLALSSTFLEVALFEVSNSNIPLFLEQESPEAIDEGPPIVDNFMKKCSQETSSYHCHLVEGHIKKARDFSIDVPLSLHGFQFFGGFQPAASAILAHSGRGVFLFFHMTFMILSARTAGARVSQPRPKSNGLAPCSRATRAAIHVCHDS